MYRIEEDYLGKLEIPEDAYYGIATARALKLFPSTGEKLDENFIWAYFMIKKAACVLNYELGYLPSDIYKSINQSCDEWNLLKTHIVVDPLSGGAGTSVNLNINEVIANRSTELLGGKKGQYIVDPYNHVNLHQSTNDTFVTAGKIATIVKLRKLEEQIIKLQESIQTKEKEFYKIRTVARTQLMDAVPILMGQQFGAWADAIARDRWRLNKVEERIRSVNIGGTAIGTGIGAPKEYILKIVDTLRQITNVKIAKAENLIDATQNLDVFSEVHGLLKSLAVNLYKISNDIRLLGSGPNTAIGELELPKLQIGSTIMPGKINPVIPEYVMQIALTIFGHDEIVTHACAQGNLQLNQFSPIIVHYTLKSLTLLTNACNALKDYILQIKAIEENCQKHLLSSMSNLTPLINYFGYEKVSQAIKNSGNNIEKAIEKLAEQEGIDKQELMTKLNISNMTKLGYR
ncbi:MAG: aspartate ammonia-lyase [Fervidobacterium sp.]|nr:aspartate ammonia-lyase [Fervidobacterium sp.]